jgi:hypothetical protein
MKKICAKRFASLSLIITVVAAGMPLAAHAGPEVVAWGDNDSGQTSVPSGLSNVVAIAAGSLHSLALTAELTRDIFDSLLDDTIAAPRVGIT